MQRCVMNQSYAPLALSGASYADAVAVLLRLRIGAIVGPTLGGVLLARELPLGQNFLIFAIPAAVSAVAMLVFALSAERPRDRLRPAAA